jgi:DNA helicase IV
VTEFYQPLFNEFVLPSFINSNVKLNTINDQNIYGQGFNKPEFVDSIILKLEKVIESLKIYDFVVWMDVDLFFAKSVEKVMKDLQNRINNYDILISPENKSGCDINSGFFAAVSSEKNINFFEQVLSEVKIKRKTEQPIFQRLLYENKHNFNILPITYWNLTVGWPIPKNCYVLHANWVVNHKKFGKLLGNNYVERKIYALRKLKDLNNA